MKKNVKILGAAAAALLAVAPVAAGVVPAASAASHPVNIRPGQSANSNTTYDGSSEARAIKAAQAYTEVSGKSGASMGDFLTPVTTSLSYAGNVSVVSYSPNANLYEGAVNASNLSGASLVPNGTTLETGHLYTQVFTVALKGQPNKWYNLGGGYVRQANSEGIIEGVPAFVTINATDSTSNQTPYFTYTNGVQPGNQVLSDGATANWTSEKYTTQTIQGIYDLTTGPASPVKINNGIITTSKADIQRQVESQGAKVAANGSFIMPKNGLIITVTGYNQISGKTVTVKLPISSAYTVTADYPVISYIPAGSSSAVYTKQGDKTTGTMPLVNIKTGDKFNAAENFSAVVNSGTGANNKLDMKVVLNNVNTNVPGLYNVVVNATNPNGLTTSVTYTVAVSNSGVTNATVNYVKGYGVNVWSLQGTNEDQPAFTGNRVMSGRQVKVYGTKVVNGVSYSRIGSANSNTWIQTQYLDGSWNRKPAKPASSETSMTGIAHVTYNGKGAVRLLNADGKYQNQYVRKGSNWKVFAKKTINGRPMYKLGTENQWIPAEYVSIR